MSEHDPRRFRLGAVDRMWLAWLALTMVFITLNSLLAWLLRHWGLDSYWNGWIVGAWLTLGFTATLQRVVARCRRRERQAVLDQLSQLEQQAGMLELTSMEEDTDE